MTRQSERELQNEIETMQGAEAADISDSDAYALLVAAASGDETAAERWGHVGQKRQQRVTQPAKEVGEQNRGSADEPI